MAATKIVNKTVLMSLEDIIQYQLITHCFINKISLTESDIECFIKLAKLGETNLSKFCTEISQKWYLEKLEAWRKDRSGKEPSISTQTVRNIISKLEKYNLIYKTEGTKKKIVINENLKFQVTGNILLNFKIGHIDDSSKS